MRRMKQSIAQEVLDSPSRPSLGEVYRSMPVPKKAGWFRKLLAFMGPGYLVAVGYMDPGNWATSLAGGSHFGYQLLFVIVLSNFLAMFLQALSGKLGIVTGMDLAQACRNSFSKPVAIMLWFFAEIAIIACDLAELIGAAVALELLFGIPLLAGVLITALDVLLILYLQNKGFRYIEILVIALIVVIAGSFVAEIIWSEPNVREVMAGLIPSKQMVTNPEMLYIAIGILGATVMPHNLYLHSSIVQTRKFDRSKQGKKEAVRFATIDSSVALLLALFINGAILVVAAAAFAKSNILVEDLSQAYYLLAPVLGTSLASILFGVALLAAGQNSTLTGTLAGQIIMEGFLRLRMKPWIQRLLTRLVAIIPAVVVTILYGEKGVMDLLVLSQVILSLQLPFAIIPLVQFTSNRKLMGDFVNKRMTQWFAWIITGLITGLNMYLLIRTIWG